MAVAVDEGQTWSYLAVRGGIAVRTVLGSRAHDTLSGIGPPPITKGMRLPVGEDPATPVVVDVAVQRPGPDRFRVWPGPRADWFDEAASTLLTATEWTVEMVSRVGLRLSGTSVRRIVTDELASEGLVAGAIQVPHDGQPVVMLADHPTTGGYPVMAVVDPDDLATLAQTPRRLHRSVPSRNVTRSVAKQDESPARPRPCRYIAAMERRIYGLENEYGVTCTLRGQRRLSPDEVARYLFRRVVSWGRSSNVFLQNGARLYLDVGSHPEYATPECDSLYDLVVHDKAGERILESLVGSAEQRLAEESIRGTIYLFKNNTDSAGNSYGCHENYLTSRSRRPRPLRRGAHPVPRQPPDLHRRRQGAPDRPRAPATRSPSAPSTSGKA